MNLSELSFISHIYNYFTNYSVDYSELIRVVKGSVDLSCECHRKALIHWLNQWGCRQFALAYHETASQEIFDWHNEYKTQLISKDKMLWDLSESDLHVISVLYDALAKKTASIKSRNNSGLNITIGPTGASKILFALRPNSMIPWDEAIRNRLKYSGDGNSFKDYLVLAQKEAESFFLSCEKHNIQPLDIPERFGRPGASIAQLIGEYFWVTLTRNCYPPPHETFRRWAQWSKV